MWTDLASVSVVFGEALFGGIALRADVAAAQLRKRHLVGVDIAAVNADVSGKLLLAVGELAPKPGRGWLLVQLLHVHWALTSDLHPKIGLQGDGRGGAPVVKPMIAMQITGLLAIKSKSHSTSSAETMVHAVLFLCRYWTDSLLQRDEA